MAMPSTDEFLIKADQKLFDRTRAMSKATTEFRLSMIDLQTRYRLTWPELESMLVELMNRGSLDLEKELWREFICTD